VVRGASGALYAGCNVENVAFPQGSCAEASAISALIMAGERRIIEVLVMGKGPALVSPCGGCRQPLREFALHAMPVHLCDPDGQWPGRCVPDDLSAPAVRVGFWIQWLASAAYPKPPGLARTKSLFSTIFHKLMVYGRILG
jgi:homotetrameric cytidine deaminase